MAGYRIFYKPTYQEIRDTLLEIGISLSYGDDIYTVTFSDNKSASFTMPGEIGAYFTNKWIFADDGSHTFMLHDSNQAPEDTDVTPDGTDDGFRLRAFIAEKEDGTLYSNNGFDGGSTLSSRYLYTMLNVPILDTSRLSNNDPGLTELKLVPLAGNFYFGSVQNIQPLYEYYIFKHAYVNYHRWFPFGTLIRGANGETYMGWGWILFRLGANS